MTNLLPSDAANTRRWDGRAAGRYEVWYATFNHRATGTGYWIRYTLEAPTASAGANDRRPYAQLWFAHFDPRDPSRTFGINKRFELPDLSCDESPFAVRIGTDSQLTNEGMAGSLSGDGHDVSWDLAWAPADSVFRLLPDVMYRRGGLGDTTVLSPNHTVALRGTVTVDGTVHTFDGEPAGQTHLWGKKHAHRWAWSHCNDFLDSPGTAFESLTVTLKRGAAVLPPLTVASLTHEGRTYAFNQYRHTLRNRGTLGTSSYELSAVGANARLDAAYTCRPRDMVVATYEDPDGELCFCRNTEIGDLRITLWTRRGPLDRWREHRRLVAPGRGHFEIGDRDRDPAIETVHTTVG